MPTGQTFVSDDGARLREELRHLTKGRGVDRGDLAERLGGAIATLAGIGRTDGPAVSRDRLTKWLSRLVAKLPLQLATSAQAAFALGEFAGQAFLADRIARLAEAEGWGERTARRRVSEAVTMIAEYAQTGGQGLEVAVPAAQAVSWPLQVGVVPEIAAGFQTRAVPDGIDYRVGGTYVIAGLAGSGKTQAAAHVVRRMYARGELDLSVWISAVGRDAVITAYSHAAEMIAPTSERSAEDGANRFLAWLASTSHRWLIVLDDVLTPADLAGLWPPTGATGTVIVTTRRRDAALASGGRSVVQVGVFAHHEAVAYLRSRLQDDQQLEGAGELAADLGYLPLALAQATAYMIDRGLSCSEYGARLRDRRYTLGALVPEASALPDDQRSTVTSTWSLSIELANSLQPQGLARPLLDVIGVLAADGIPMAVMTAPSVLDYAARHRNHHLATEETDLRDALFCLHRLSLITLDSADSAWTVRVHRLVQRVTREQLPVERHDDLVRCAAEALAHVWPETELDGDLSSSLRASTVELYRHDPTSIWTQGLQQILFRAGRSLGLAGQFAAATSFWNQIRDDAIRFVGHDHPDTLTARGSAALWLGEAGDAAGAVSSYRELAKDFERVLGPDDPRTLATRHNLASWRLQAGEISDAATELAALLLDQQRVIGSDHPDTLITRHNLALLRGESGDPVGAAATLAELLSGEVRIVGPDHPRTLTTRHNLAYWRGQAGDTANAADILSSLLLDQIRVLGADHPDTLTTRHLLASLRGQAGDAAAAVNGLAELLADRQRTLGSDHPQTLTTRHNLAYWRLVDGDVAAAVNGLAELLTDRQRVLGSDHPDTLATRHLLASLRGQAGDAGAAVRALAELLADRRRVLGNDHPQTLTTRHNLAYWRLEAGDVGAAVNGLAELLADRQRVLGSDHPDTLNTMRTLAHALQLTGRHGDAVRLLQEALTRLERIFGATHAETQAVRDELGQLVSEADSVYARAKFSIDAGAAQGVQIGDMNTQHNLFNR